jgi:hypothetical protein
VSAWQSSENNLISMFVAKGHDHKIKEINGLINLEKMIQRAIINYEAELKTLVSNCRLQI